MSTASLNRGQSFAALSIFFGVVSSVCLKLGDTTPSSQAVAIRSFVVVLVLFPFVLFVWRGGRTTFNRHTLIQSVIGAAAALTTALAVFQLPISLIMTFLAALPAFSTLSARVILAEGVSGSAWLGIFGAFVGCLIVLQPALDLSALGAALILCSIVFFTARDIYTRKFAADLNAGTSVAMTNVLVLSFSIFMVPAGAWVTPPLEDYALLAISGLFGAGSGYYILRAHQLTQVSLIAPLRFTSILWALLFDWLIWGFLPGPVTWLGIAIISASVLVIIGANRRSANINGPLA